LQTKQAYFYIDSLHLLSIINQVAYNYPLLLNKKISVLANKIFCVRQFEEDYQSAHYHRSGQAGSRQATLKTKPMKRCR
jgi:hypothetical protein